HQERRAHAGAANDRDLHGRSALRGSDETPPAASVERAPTKLPMRRHSRGGDPPSTPKRNPPLNASPAPVVSTARTRGAGTLTSMPSDSQRLPRLPSLMIVARAWRPQNAVVRAALRSRAYNRDSGSFTNT